MPLTQRQTDQLRAAIEARREALLAEMRADVARAREQPYSKLAGAVTDSGDESVATLIADLEQAELTRDLGEFRLLDAARARLRDGSYGICADCGSDIGFARLQAHPGAIRCTQCQQRHERTHGGDSKPSL